MEKIDGYTEKLVQLCIKNDQIDKKLYDEYGVKK